MKKYLVLLLVVVIASCGSGGMLGGFKSESFSVSKKQLVIAIDSFYKENPDDTVPEKWKEFDDWHRRGFDFLDSRIFYFSAPPEEMYYVTFIGDSLTQVDPGYICIAIRAVCQRSPKWILERDCSEKEINRIESRFEKEVVNKLNILLEYQRLRSQKQNQ